MEYPSNCQIFGNQYYEKAKQRKQLPKLQHHQTDSAKVRQRVWFRTGVRPIFEYGIVSTMTVSEAVITKIQRVQNSFIRLALRLPKYDTPRLLHEASGLLYVRERLMTEGQNHLARMHANPLAEHTINSARTNITWDKYKTPISILKQPD